MSRTQDETSKCPKERRIAFRAAIARSKSIEVVPALRTTARPGLAARRPAKKRGASRKEHKRHPEWDGDHPTTGGGRHVPGRPPLNRGLSLAEVPLPSRLDRLVESLRKAKTQLRARPQIPRSAGLQHDRIAELRRHEEHRPSRTGKPAGRQHDAQREAEPRCNARESATSCLCSRHAATHRTELSRSPTRRMGRTFGLPAESLPTLPPYVTLSHRNHRN